LRLSGSRRGASAAAARPIGTLTKRIHSQPAYSGDERGAEALHRARRDEPDVGLREPAEQRREREEDQAADEHPPAPEEVGHAAAEEEEAAEGQRVGVDDPREVVLVEVERLADRRQRDVDDRGVEDDDELRQGEQGEGEVLRAGGHGGCHS
jgi:hypothetical protein